MARRSFEERSGPAHPGMDRWMHCSALMHGRLSVVLFGGPWALLTAGCGGAPFEAASSQPAIDASVEASAGDTTADAGASTDGAVAGGDASTGAPSSTFPCGQQACTAVTQYCFGSIARQPTCRSTPSACLPSPSCACVEQRDTQCANPTCTSDGGAVTVTCKL